MTCGGISRSELKSLVVHFIHTVIASIRTVREFHSSCLHMNCQNAPNIDCGAIAL